MYLASMVSESCAVCCSKAELEAQLLWAPTAVLLSPGEQPFNQRAAAVARCLSGIAEACATSLCCDVQPGPTAEQQQICCWLSVRMLRARISQNTDSDSVWKFLNRAWLRLLTISERSGSQIVAEHVKQGDRRAALTVPLLDHHRSLYAVPVSRPSPFQQANAIK